jgi:peptide deformylase
MVKKIIQYPQSLGLAYAIDVRVFDETLFSLIDDLRDTIMENNLEGLSAFQIGNYYNVVVIKQDDNTFLEMINPRLISYEGHRTAEEMTAYYPGKKAITQRYNTITVVYQDRFGSDQSLLVSGDLAIVIQRKIDYTFGATFIHKMSKEERDIFEKNLERKEKSWLRKLLPL